MRITSAVLTEAGRARPYSDSSPITFETLELDAPGPTEVLVRIEAAGLCHSDLSVVNGDRVRPLPMALGHEASGVVERVGDDVTTLSVGDHVVMVYVPSCGRCSYCLDGQPALCEPGAAANGAGELLAGGRRLHRAAPPAAGAAPATAATDPATPTTDPATAATDPAAGAAPATPTTDPATVNHHLGVSAFAGHAVVDASSAVNVGDDIPFDVAALFGCAMATGYGAVTRTAGVRAGDSVVIIGAGGVGLSAVIAAHAAGAEHVIVVDPVASKRERALELGATAATAPDAAADLVQTTLHGGADWVFEAVGSAPVMQQAFALTRRGGTTVYMGLPHPSAEFTVPALQIIAESRTVKGSYMGSTRPHDDIPAMAELWRSGVLPVDRLISAHRPLSELNEALEALADGTALRQILLPEHPEPSTAEDAAPGAAR